MKDNKTKNIKMEAAIIFDSHLPNAFREALKYAGDEGFVASMPQLLHARANAEYDNIIWNTWFTSNTEESVITTPQGNRVVIVVHGGGIFSTPERFERTLHADMDRSNTEGLTGQYAAKITKLEAYDILEGKLPNGTEIPIFSFDEFKRGVLELPLRYGVILDFELAKKSLSGYETFDALRDEPNMIARAGGPEPLAAYLNKAKARNNTKLMGNWHPYKRIDPDQNQTRIVFLAGNKGGLDSDGKNQGLGWGYDAEYGIGGDASFVNMARYIAVAPQNVSAEIRYLDFEV
jgi:hypothetical protein